MVDQWKRDTKHHINRPKIPHKSQKLSTEIVYPSPKVWDFDEKRLYWASVVRGLKEYPIDLGRIMYNKYLPISI